MGPKGAAKVTVWKPDLCNAPSGALGSPTWTCEVTQGNSEGSRVQAQPEIRRRRSKRVEVDRGSMGVDVIRKRVTV